MILTTGIHDIDSSKFNCPRFWDEHYFVNKPYGGLWGSTYTPDDDYVSDWVNWTCNEQFKFYKYGVVYELKSNSKVYEVRDVEGYINLLKTYGKSYCPVYNFYKMFIDWDRLCKEYDAIHIEAEAVFGGRYISFLDGREFGFDCGISDLYSYDAESWIVFNLNAIDMSTVKHVTITDDGGLEKIY